MKRVLQVLIAVLLLLSMLLVMTSCFSPIENPDPPGNKDKVDDDDNDDDDDDDDDNPYAYIFTAILAKINGLQSIEDYLDLLSYLYETLPADKLSAAVETLAGVQYGNMIKDYYTKGAEVLAMANIAAPFVEYLPYIGLIKDYIGNGLDTPVARSVLRQAGVTVADETEGVSYSYTHDEVDYKVTVVESTYTVSFSDKIVIIETFEDNENLYGITFNDGAIERNILFEYSETLYKVTESGILYEVAFDEEDQTFSFSGTDVDSGLTQYLFESVITDDSNLAIQFYQAESGWLIQLLTVIADNEAVVSLQNDISTEPQTIVGNVGASFATLGTIFTIDESTLGALLPN